MKICIFSRPFYPAVGGLEAIAETLAVEFSLIGCDVEVVTDTKVSNKQNKQFPFKIRRTSSIKERYTAFKKADVILFMNFTFAGVPIALLSLRPIVLSHHGIYQSSGSLKIRFLEFTKKQSTRFFTNISVSQFVARNLPGKSIVVPNAFNESLFRIQEFKREKNFVFCGRLVSDKGANVLIDAFQIVLNTNPNATLTIIGDGPEKPALYEKSNLNGMSKNVSFAGILRGESLVNKLREHSCMVIPSLWEEPFGIVALEGIALCDTVIASNRGGLPEAVGNCGVLVEPTAKKFADAMISVLKALEMGMLLPGQPSLEKRRAHLEAHSPKQVAQKYLSVCQQAIDR